MNVSSPPLLIRGAQVLTMNPGEKIAPADLLAEEGRIIALGPDLNAPPGARIIEAAGLTLLPGLVQAHLHLCQTLFRGEAEDLELLDWLQQKILPFEAAHTEASIRASARLAITELLLSGTTAIQSMETVHHTEVTLEVLATAGLNALTGGCLIDRGENIPPNMVRPRNKALEEQLNLARKWNGGGAVEVALCPRFALSCSEELLRDCAEAGRDLNLRIHSHAAENKKEVAAVRQLHGHSDIELLDRVGILGARTGLAHCIHVAQGDMNRLRQSGTHVITCPSANLKLASGIAPVTEYLAAGIPLALGADGAPCNNRLDPWTEMRSLALLQKFKAGPTAGSAATALAIATHGGARALGREQDLGTIAVGKRADFLLMDLASPWLGPGGSPESKLVYAAGPRDIKLVILGGKVVVEGGRVLLWDQDEVAAKARIELTELKKRIT